MSVDYVVRTPSLEEVANPPHHFSELEPGVHTIYEPGFKAGCDWALSYPRNPECKVGNYYNNVRPGMEGPIYLPDGQVYNANRIGPQQIICGNPGVAHVNEFWSMVLHNHVKNIILVSPWSEKGKPKVNPNILPARGKMMLGPPSVTHWTHTDRDTYGVTQYSLEVDDGQSKSVHVRMFHFDQWMDHGVVDSMQVLYKFFRNHLDVERNPTDVNLYMCSAGLGRSGTMAMIDMLLQDPKQTGYEAFTRIRKVRPGAIQTVKQYSFAHVFVNYYWSERRREETKDEEDTSEPVTPKLNE